MPKPLFTFAKKKARRLAIKRGRGERPNLSEYISDLNLTGDNCTLQFKDEELIVSARSADEAIPSDGVEILPIPKTKGFKYKLQLQFLIEALESAPDAELVLSFTEPLKPLVIKGKDGSWLNCIMGLRPDGDVSPGKAVPA